MSDMAGALLRMCPHSSRGPFHGDGGGYFLDSSRMHANIREHADLASRLRAALDATDMGTVELARRIGASDSYVRDILNGRSKQPGAARMRRIAGELGVSVDWLLGAGDPAAPEAAVSGFAEESQASEWLPPPRAPGDNRPELLDVLRGLLPPDARPAYLKANVTLPGIAVLAGDLVIIEMKRPPERGEIVAVQRVDEATASAVTVFRRWLDPWLVPPCASLAVAPELGRPGDCRPLIGVLRMPQLLPDLAA